MTADISAVAADGAASDSPRPPDLAALLRQAQSGDSTALGHLIRSITPILWQVVRQQGLSVQTSEDVIQTAWLRLFRSPETLREPKALVGWLVTVCRREAWRLSAHQSRVVAAGEQVLERMVASGPDPEWTVIANEQHRVLWEALSTLSARCRELLRIVAYVHRPSNASVAETLAIPMGSVGPTRRRCLDKLRTVLTNDPRWSA